MRPENVIKDEDKQSLKQRIIDSEKEEDDIEKERKENE